MARSERLPFLKFLNILLMTINKSALSRQKAVLGIDDALIKGGVSFVTLGEVRQLSYDAIVHIYNSSPHNSAATRTVSSSVV